MVKYLVQCLAGSVLFSSTFPVLTHSSAQLKPTWPSARANPALNPQLQNQLRRCSEISTEQPFFEFISLASRNPLGY